MGRVDSSETCIHESFLSDACMVESSSVGKWGAGGLPHTALAYPRDDGQPLSDKKRSEILISMVAARRGGWGEPPTVSSLLWRG